MAASGPPPTVSSWAPASPGDVPPAECAAARSFLETPVPLPAVSSTVVRNYPAQPAPGHWPGQRRAGSGAAPSGHDSLQNAATPRTSFSRARRSADEARKRISVDELGPSGDAPGAGARDGRAAAEAAAGDREAAPAASGQTALSTSSDTAVMNQAHTALGARAWQITVLKYAIFVALLCGGAGIGTWSYVSGTQTQLDNFSQLYTGMVDQLDVHLPLALGLKRGAGDIVGNLFAFERGLPSIGEFLSIGNILALQTGAKTVEYCPRVASADRPAYEASVRRSLAGQYAVSPQADLGTLRDLAQLGFWQQSASGRVPSPDREAYFPIVYLAPIESNEGAFLFDALSTADRDSALALAMASGQPYVTELLYLVEDVVPRPASLIYAPVLSNATGQLLGLSCVVFYWDSLLDSGLPTALYGIDIVLESATGLQHTFRLDSAQVASVGTGDHHDTSLDAYHRTTQLTMGLTYTFNMYPTRALFESQQSTYPRDGLISIILIIFFCIGAFVVYDVIAARLARLLASEVTVTTRIIDRLTDAVFPDIVKDRLVQEAAAAEVAAATAAGATHRRSADLGSGSAPGGGPRAGGGRASGPGLSSASSILSRGNSFLDRPVHTAMALLDAQHRSTGERSVSNAAPGGAAGAGGGPVAEPGIIADSYPNVTVLFSDIVEFTTWSATVPPVKIFETLEYMVALFDDLAKVHGIFKVETIGDSYIASCGCPDASPTHAPQMADFALAIVGAMAQVRAHCGVPDMRLRVGINSGPVTAGVLRTNFRRFQLFGDTMNLASRLETNSEPDRIHVSDSTQALLAAEGSHVLEQRGLVHLKGKGLLTTYWLVGRTPGYVPCLRSPEEHFGSPKAPRVSTERTAGWPGWFGPAAGSRRHPPESPLLTSGTAHESAVMRARLNSSGAGGDASVANSESDWGPLPEAALDLQATNGQPGHGGARRSSSYIPTDREPSGVSAPEDDPRTSGRLEERQAPRRAGAAPRWPFAACWGGRAAAVVALPGYSGSRPATPKELAAGDAAGDAPDGSNRDPMAHGGGGIVVSIGPSTSGSCRGLAGGVSASQTSEGCGQIAPRSSLSELDDAEAALRYWPSLTPPEEHFLSPAPAPTPWRPAAPPPSAPPRSGEQVRLPAQLPAIPAELRSGLLPPLMGGGPGARPL